MRPPFCREFNRVILELAPRHIARDVMPIFTLETRPEALRELMTGDGLAVWSGGSDATVYGDARVNHAFRAWHDSVHLAGLHGFTLEGERATCEAQIAGLLRAYPRTPARVLALIRAEIVGQAEYFFATGDFPTDQAAFINQHLQEG